MLILFMMALLVLYLLNKTNYFLLPRKQLFLELKLLAIARMLLSLPTDAIAMLTPEEIPLIRSLLS